MSKIILGLSGGVDSALAASLLKSGHDVVGVYLDITGSGAPEAAVDAARVLGIELIVRDVSALLEERVCAPFAESYLSGETPIPCIVCNREMKFATLFAVADEIGAKRVATGHYARVGTYAGAAAICRGASAKKDQSYMLYRLERQWLSRLIFPLGEYADKEAVRADAREAGLIRAAESSDSQDICFIPDGDYAGWIERRGVFPPPGDIVDEDGRVLGRHEGIHRHTVGQRRGLGIAAGERVYVSRIDREKNQVVLARGTALGSRIVRARGCHLLTDALPEWVDAKVRYAAKAERARVLEADEGGMLTVEFEEPVRAPAPGQSLVLYDGDTLLGGGYITR